MDAKLDTEPYSHRRGPPNLSERCSERCGSGSKLKEYVSGSTLAALGDEHAAQTSPKSSQRRILTNSQLWKRRTESFCSFLEENEHSGFHCFAGGRSAVSKPASSVVSAGSAALNPIAKKYYKTLLKRSKWKFMGPIPLLQKFRYAASLNDFEFSRGSKASIEPCPNAHLHQNVKKTNSNAAASWNFNGVH